jgi:hypothetical protein
MPQMLTDLIIILLMAAPFGLGSYCRNNLFIAELVALIYQNKAMQRVWMVV